MNNINNFYAIFGSAIIVFILLLISTIVSFTNFRNSYSLVAGIISLFTLILVSGMAFLSPEIMVKSYAFIVTVYLVFFITIILIIVSKLNSKIIENFGGIGTCIQNKKVGIFKNNICINQKDGFAINSSIYNDEEKKNVKKTGICLDENGDVYPAFNETCKEAIERIQNGRVSSAKKTSPNTNSASSETGKLLEPNKEASMLRTGPCYAKDMSTNKYFFGINLPKYGARCIPYDRVQEDLINRRSTTVTTSPQEIYANQLPKCYPENTESIFLDKECKIQFNYNYGLKNKVNCSYEKNNCNRDNCSVQGITGVCAEGYQIGETLSDRSTKCVPVGTDMNNVCNRVMKKKLENSKYLNYGYKYQTGKGCPDNFFRAECSGNYFDGDELYPDFTDCVSQNEDLDTECQNKFKQASFADGVKVANCLPGYIRGKCRNID